MWLASPSGSGRLRMSETRCIHTYIHKRKLADARPNCRDILYLKMGKLNRMVKPAAATVDEKTRL